MGSSQMDSLTAVDQILMKHLLIEDEDEEFIYPSGEAGKGLKLHQQLEVIDAKLVRNDSTQIEGLGLQLQAEQLEYDANGIITENGFDCGLLKSYSLQMPSVAHLHEIVYKCEQQGYKKDMMTQQ